jgi:pectate lyase
VKLEGFATVNANGVATTTGGGNASPTTVTTFAALMAAAQDSAPRVIIVSGTIRTTDGGGAAMRVASNKTIMGANKSATIYGGIEMNGVNNVIVRNLNIQGTWPNSGPDDTVASRNSHHIWYDHLNIWDSTDGSLDITNQSNYQTVSWTKFWYSNSTHDHRLASLNGSGGGDHPEDSRYLKITYHHNWWGQYVDQRMPRVMYGKGHQYNNYFNSPGNLYCIGVGSFGSVLVENNYFKGVNGPHIFQYAWHMYIAATGNVYDGTTGNRHTGMGGTRDTNDPALNAGVEDAAAFTPPYTYALDAAADVPALVQKCAGPQ